MNQQLDPKALARGVFLGAVFTREVMNGLRRRSSSPGLCRRLEILTARGPDTDSLNPWVHDQIRRDRARRAAWDTYVEAAYVAGLFDGERGRELLGNLRSPEEDQFRAAMAECHVAWLLAGPFRLQVRPPESGRNGTLLDLLAIAEDADLHIEVKAPRVSELGYPEISQQAHFVDFDSPSSKLGRVLSNANRKFEEGRLNLLLLVPELDLIFTSESRRLLLQAFVGHPVIAYDFDAAQGRLVGEPRDELVGDGSLLKLAPRAQATSEGLLPRYTRVSAIMWVESKIHQSAPPSALTRREYDPLREDPLFSTIRREQGIPDPHRSFNMREIGLALEADNRTVTGDLYEYRSEVLLAPNPNAANALPEGIFPDVPTLISSGGKVHWSDAHALI